MHTCIDHGKTIADDADRRPIHSGLAMHEQCYKRCQQRSQPAKWVLAFILVCNAVSHLLSLPTHQPRRSGLIQP